MRWKAGLIYVTLYHKENIAIYERKKVPSITKEEYQRFLDNDEQLAKIFGKNIPLFQRNKADVDFDELNYDFVKLHETIENSGFGEQILITINNPYMLKIRPEKQIALVLGMSRSQVKSLLGKGEIKIKTEQPQGISISINSCQFPMA